MNSKNSTTITNSTFTVFETDSQIIISSDDNNMNKLVLNGEFVYQQASDFILVIQNDAVLCHGLDVYLWNQFPYVGAPWPTEYWCNKFKSHWDEWHNTNTTTTTTTTTGSNESESYIPPYPNTNDLCTDTVVGPYGNGGLSFRSRYWMHEVIHYCSLVN